MNLTSSILFHQFCSIAKRYSDVRLHVESFSTALVCSNDFFALSRQYFHFVRTPSSKEWSPIVSHEQNNKVQSFYTIQPNIRQNIHCFERVDFVISLIIEAMTNVVPTSYTDSAKAGRCMETRLRPESNVELHMRRTKLSELSSW